MKEPSKETFETEADAIYDAVWKKLGISMSGEDTAKTWNHWELVELVTNIVIEYKVDETVRCLVACRDVNRENHGRWRRDCVEAEIERRIDEMGGDEWQDQCAWNEQGNVHSQDGKSGSK